LAEIAGPVFKHRMRIWKKKRARAQVADVGMQYVQKMLDEEMDIEPHGNPKLCFDGSIEEYTEIAVTLGFLVLWGVTWPLAGMLTWLCLLFELYLDQFKIMNLVRRPFPKKEIGFEFWEELFSKLTIAAVFVNAAVLVVTAKITFIGELICTSALSQPVCPRQQDPEDPRTIFGPAELISFLVYLTVFFGLLAICRSLLPSERREVRTATNRFKHVVERLSQPKVGSSLQEWDERCDFRISAF
jgi:hypothetical protein